MKNENNGVKMAKCYLGNNRQVEGPAELVSAYINLQNRVKNLKQNFSLAVTAMEQAGVNWQQEKKRLEGEFKITQKQQQSQSDDSDNPFTD